jgi:hypothetical protein
MPINNDTQGTVQGVADIYAGETDYNQISFMMRSMMQKEINVAMPVRVTKVMEGSGAVGYVQALPLVNDMDAQGNAVDVAVIPSLPYFRLQGGKVAVITDPIVGDIGIAVFAQKDTSNVVAGTDKPVQAGSFRKFSMSDGWYIGGFLNQAPETFLQLNQDGTAVLTANSGVTINGDVTINGELTAKGIVYSTHVHGGVMSGGSDTSTPH